MAIIRDIPGIKRMFKKVRGAHARGCQVGLKKAGLFVLRESLKIVPVDLGHLRASQFIRHTGAGFKTQVRVGYTAKYAIFVHENLEAAHGAAYNQKHADKISGNKERDQKGRFTAVKKHAYRYERAVRSVDYKQSRKVRYEIITNHYHARGPNQQAKFLERPVRENRKLIGEIVREEIYQ